MQFAIHLTSFSAENYRHYSPNRCNLSIIPSFYKSVFSSLLVCGGTCVEPFEALYNFIHRKRNAILLTAAPPPRRFAQGLAGTLSLIIGISLYFNITINAYIFEAILLLAIVLLVFGRFCLGSFVYHLITGNLDFAKKTLPWKQLEADSKIISIYPQFFIYL